MEDKQKLVDRIKHFVLDMDGTFYLGSRILDGSLDFLKKVKETGRDFIFFTNNSSKSPSVYLDKLAGMNCFVDRSQMMTSGDVTIEYLNTVYPGKPVYLMGTPALVQSFKEGGINLVEDGAEIVVVGFDTTLTYDKLTKVCDYVRNGAIYIATHTDINCPVENGFIPDVGSFCALISKSTGGFEPRVLGKPNPEGIYKAMEELEENNKDKVVYIGDNVIDYETGIAAGVHTGIVKWGPRDFPKDLQPDFRLINYAHLKENLYE